MRGMVDRGRPAACLGVACVLVQVLDGLGEESARAHSGKRSLNHGLREEVVEGEAALLFRWRFSRYGRGVGTNHGGWVRRITRLVWVCHRFGPPSPKFPF